MMPLDDRGMMRIPTATEIAQGLVHFSQRCCWGVNYLDRHREELSEETRAALDTAIERLSDERLFGANWRRFAERRNLRELGARISAISESLQAQTVQVVAAILNNNAAGFRELRERTGAALAVAQGELETWETVAAVSALPNDLLQAGFAGAGRAAGAVAAGTIGGIMSGLLSNPIGLAVIGIGAYLIFRSSKGAQTQSA